MSVIIIGDLFSFPDGFAATNRVYTYAKGLQENGVKTHVICFSSDYVKQFDGISDGINYYHPFRQSERSKSFLKRRWQNLKKNINTYKILKNINKEDKIIAINSWTNSFYVYILIWFYSRLLGTRLTPEISEHPLRYYQKNIFTKKFGRIKLFVESRLSDGIFCISKFLINFYLKEGVPDRKLFLIPSTVDPSRFVQAGERPIPEQYIGYFGSLSFDRDNVDLLLNAFAIFKKSHPRVILVLGGICSPQEKNEILNLIDELSIASEVILLEYMTREEIVKYITHADALVMVRRNDVSTRASYPSKLSEYLATGRPVVSVIVGEIADYLSDGMNAYLVEPGNKEGLSDKLDFIFKNPEKAALVGEKGKLLTNTTFHYKHQGKRIIDFIKSLQ